jgi:hypothetical protein
VGQLKPVNLQIGTIHGTVNERIMNNYLLCVNGRYAKSRKNQAEPDSGYHFFHMKNLYFHPDDYPDG